MKKMFYSIAGVSVLLLLGLGACNLPRFSGGTDGADGPNGTDQRSTGPTNTDGAETILIPGATFWMGSESTEAQADADEMPRHQVTLDSFYVYTHEVTNEMYAECVEAGACLPIQVMDSGPTSHFVDREFGDHPLTGADWNMGRDYCAWANGRLPTEAEWELAARGTDSLSYPWGEEAPACDRVNMLGCLVPPDTAEVGSYELGNSPEGVWDMSGNVWEWVHDWYDEDYYLFSAASSPLGPNIGELKAVRSGGLYSEPVQMRTAARVGTNPYRAYDDVGFRCVAMGPLGLPAGYVGTDGRHERVPADPLDGGGESLEEPDGLDSFSVGDGVASCPGPDGRMHIFVEADTSVEGIDYSVRVQGNPFDCYYDEMLRGLQCEGPVPDDNEELAHYYIAVIFGDFGGMEVFVDRPLDCPAEPGPPAELSATASCPDEGGIVTVTFVSDPPVAWDTVLLEVGGIYEPVASCTIVSDTEMTCFVAARAPGDLYHFSLHGFDAEGHEYSPWAVASVPDDCLPGLRVVMVEPFCFEGHPGVIVTYPADVMELANVLTVGVPLSCIGMAPGVMFCGDLPGAPGSPATVTTCFTGEPCSDRTVTVPACPATGPIYEIVPACHDFLGPVVNIQYFPADEPLVAANANGFDLTCFEAGGGWYGCYTLPGAAGSTMTVTFCLADGSCFADEVIVPTCEEVPPEGEWTISGYGCHDETDIFFSVDTGLDWLVPGADYTYSASDEEGSYACSLIPAVPGRMYCSGPRPETPGTLQVCVHPDGGSLTCEYFDEFPGLVAAIPSCVEEPPPDTGPSCADYTDPPTCDLHPGECHWEKLPSPGYCAEGPYP